MPTHNQPAVVADIPRPARLAHTGLHTLFAPPTPTRTVAPPTLASIAGAAVARERAFWQLSATARVALMRRGKLTLAQCCAWAARAPDEVSLLDGEFEFIAARLADRDPD